MRYSLTKPKDMKQLFLGLILLCAIQNMQAQTVDPIKPISKNEKLASPKVKVFPNPATRVVNVLGLVNSSAAQISISDIYGKQLLSHEWEIRNNALNIPIAELEAGIYVIVIQSKEQQVKTKFYKQ